MSFRTFLPLLGLFCLFCSSAQAQTLDDTLLKMTVNLFPMSFTDPGYPEVGVSVDFPGLEFSSSVGLPQGEFGIPEGFVSYSINSTQAFVQVIYIPAPMICSPPETLPSSCYLVQSLQVWTTGPITAFGTYPIGGSGWLVNQEFGFPVNGEITVAPTPEPVSGSLMAIGLVMVALRRRLCRSTPADC